MTFYDDLKDVLKTNGDNEQNVSFEGAAILEFIAIHFDVVPLTGAGRDAVANTQYDNDGRRNRV